MREKSLFLIFPSYKSHILSFDGGIKIKNHQKLVIFSGSFILILLSYFVFFPILLVGFPTPLFIINNNDLQSHEVTVEVFDSHNKSILKETYELAPEEHVSQHKSLWLLFRWSMPWSKGEYMYWAEGEYEFKVTLDRNITDTCRTLPHAWSSVDIDINKANTSSYPMDIGVITV